jgi:predicted small secreted protein
MFLTSILLIALFALSGCNTVKGIGEDFESLGESIQNAGD